MGCTPIFRRLSYKIISCGEIEPSIHTIKVKDRKHWDDKHEQFVSATNTYTLAFPYLQFFLLKTSVDYDPYDPHYQYYALATWRSESFTTMTQKVTPVLLPNVHTTGKLCLGTAWDYRNSKLKDIHSLFWTVVFTRQDGWPYEDNIHNTPLKSLTNWEKLTKKYGDPDFMLKLDLWSYRKSFSELLKQL